MINEIGDTFAENDEQRNQLKDYRKTYKRYTDLLTAIADANRELSEARAAENSEADVAAIKGRIVEGDRNLSRMEYMLSL